MLLVAQHMVQFELLGIEPPPMSDREFSWPVYDIFETADGRPMFVGAVTEGQWDMLCGILGLEKFLADPGLRTRVDQIADRERTLPEFHRAIASRRFGELQSAFEKNGIPFAPVATPAEMYDDPQANSGGLPVSELPDGSSMCAPGLPVEVDAARTGVAANVPAKGADTSDLLASLGYSADFIRHATGVGS